MFAEVTLGRYSWTIRSTLSSGESVREDGNPGYAAMNDADFTAQSPYERLAIPWLALQLLFGENRAKCFDYTRRQRLLTGSDWKQTAIAA